jgi:MMP 1-O-methyltransferase
MIPYAYLLPSKAIRWLVRPYRSIDGFLTEAEAVALFRLANRTGRETTVVEIGSWKGKSTYCLARGIQTGCLHAIDPFDAAGEPGSAEIYAKQRGDQPLRDEFERNLGACRERVLIHQGFSREFVTAFSSIDLLLVDGDHSVAGCRFDFESFGPKVVRGGFIAFHDYYPDRGELGPTWVIEHLVKPGGEFEECFRADSLWVGRKIR